MTTVTDTLEIVGRTSHQHRLPDMRPPQKTLRMTSVSCDKPFRNMPRYGSAAKLPSTVRHVVDTVELPKLRYNYVVVEIRTARDILEACRRDCSRTTGDPPSDTGALPESLSRFSKHASTKSIWVLS